MRPAYDCIRSIIRTEKSTLQEPQGKYLFIVDTAANKVQICKAVEEIYKVKVTKVNTYISVGKLKQVRYKAGRTPNVKRAIVTLKKGDKIDFTQ